MSVDPVEILHETDRILDEQGWAEAGPRGKNGEFCLGRAMQEALARHGLLGSERTQALRDAVRDEAQDFVGRDAVATTSIAHFNDKVAESLEDIKRVTKGARVRLGGEG